MTTDDYTASLAKLGCRSAPEAANLLGVSRRMAQYYAAGRPIPSPIAKLIRSLLRERLRGVVSDSGAMANLTSDHL